MTIKKTLTMRLLEGKNIAYEAITYDAKERDATKIAKLLDVPEEQVFKTLVVAAPKDSRFLPKPLLAILPANRRLDLKKLASEIGVKKLKMASHQQAEALTGLKVGGISPLVLVNKGFAIYLDESAFIQSHVFVSSGERGSQIKLAPADLQALTKARLVDLSTPV